MKHHFADLYERSFGYLTIASNSERWASHFPDLDEAPIETDRLTITRNDRNWQKAREFPKLVELTLHEPNQSQLAALADFRGLRALRITHARPKTLDMIAGLRNLRELVLEYVSAVSDLGPVGRLPSLTALHLENLRRVSNFSGLGASKSLRYVAISGTLDWDQPVESFDFLHDMENLEHLNLGVGVRVPKTPAVFRSLVGHKKMARLKIGMGTLPLDEFAWLEAKLPHIDGTVRPAFVRFGGCSRPIHAEDYRAKLTLEEFQRLPRVFIGEDGNRYEMIPYQAYLLGKGQRVVYGTDEHVAAKCAEHEEKYRALIAGVMANRSETGIGTFR
ncbi:MAG: hypothetical protein J2P54_05035 [Bradyrhizobiaceae bacterium]|nr:hypothetical protein [Bradyrhizobiaceae bacterium]